jgi:hypothetical protein
MRQQREEYIFVLGDGDHVREQIEYHLFNHDLSLAAKLSQKLVEAISRIKATAISLMKAEVIIAGGDDILFKVRIEDYQTAHIQTLGTLFSHTVGSNISFGVGKTIETAYINLRKAKVSRGAKIVEEE